MDFTICDITSIIGVASGVVAMVFYNIRMSRCTTIKCPCCEITRTVVENPTHTGEQQV